MTQSKTSDVRFFEEPAGLRRARREHPQGLTPPQLGKLIGVSGRTVERRCKGGALPFIDHGPKIHLIQWPVIHLVTRHGLRGVELMVRSGKL